MTTLERRCTLPLSMAQYGIWLGQQLDPTSPAYWTAETIELHGDLDHIAFESALTHTLSTCQALHMRYVQQNDVVEQTLDTQPDWTLHRLDFSQHPEAQTAMQAWIHADLQRSADLRLGPLFNTALITLGPTHHVWYLRAHHIALDGFAYALLANQLAQAYTAHRHHRALNTFNAEHLGIEPVVQEDTRYRASNAFERDRQFWVNTLGENHTAAVLAAPAPLAHRVQRNRCHVEALDFQQWQGTANRLGVDWSVFAIAAVAAWVHRTTGVVEVTLGLPVMNRLGSVALTVPCMAMNIVPLKLHVQPEHTFAELVQATAAALKAVRRHQRYRYEDLKRDVGIGASTRRLFGVVVNIMPFDRPLQFDVLQAQSNPIASGPVEDLAISLAPNAHGLRFDVEANPNAYTESVLQTHHAALRDVLSLVATHPERSIGALPQRETASVLVGEPLPFEPIPVLEAIVLQAIANPDRIALTQDGQPDYTYSELLNAVHTLAGTLAAKGIGADDRVAIVLPRSPQMIVALLAVLWVGAGYVPLDPNGPPMRLQHVLNDVKPALVLTQQGLASTLPHGVEVLCLDRHSALQVDPMTIAASVPSNALAYIIYTSGSTGQPNGVMVNRSALAHFVAAANVRYGLHTEDRVLQFAPLHFDASVEEIFLSLCHGATLVLRTEAMLESMPAFLAVCARLRITVLDLPTAFWHELAYAAGCGRVRLPECLRLTLIGGEAALAERVKRWQETAPPGSVLLNTYGPTESTVICTTAQLAGPNTPPLQRDSVPIGTPLAGLQIFVLDEGMRPVPRGMPGQLCLSGPMLARGYWGREALSAERFVQLHTVPNTPRVYRTGDLAVLEPEGTLRYLGRLDDEFKLSGHRIDPAEVETALLTHPHIQEAAVTGQTLPNGTKRLAACVVAQPMPEPSALRAWLLERLAAPAVPTVFLNLDRLPRNANGKIDRKALCKHANDTPVAQIETNNPLERLIVSVCRDILGIADLSAEHDFFSSGGNSLQAIQMANRLSTQLQREVAVSLLFRHPTPAGLAQALDTPEGHQPPATHSNPFAPLITLQTGQQPGLFCIHPAEGLSWCYWGLAAQLPQHALYGLQARGLTGEKPEHIHDMVADYLQLIQAEQPQGPYRLLGWSSGGGIAHALATALQQAGHTVDFLAMMDSFPSDIWAGKPPAQERDALLALLDVIGDAPIDPEGNPLSEHAIRARLKRPGSTLAAFDDAHITRLIDMALHSMHIYRDLRHTPFEGHVLYFQAQRRNNTAPDFHTWKPYITGHMECIGIDSTHSGMCQRTSLSHVGRIVAQTIGQLNDTQGT